MSRSPGKPRPLTENMVRVLLNLDAGHPASQHCKTQSQYGGLSGTLFALMGRGLITNRETLTAAGREAVAALKRKP